MKLACFNEKNIVRQKYQVRVQNLERVERVHVSVFLCVHHTECIQCGVSCVSVQSPGLMPLCAHHVVLCIVSWAFSPPLLQRLHPSHSLRSSPPVHTWETQVKSGHQQVRTSIGINSGIKWSEKNNRQYHLWIILFDMFFHRQSTPVWLKWLRRSYPQVRPLILTLWVIR